MDRTTFPFGIYVSSEDKLGADLDFSLLKNVGFMVANAGHLMWHDSTLKESQDPMFAIWVQKAYNLDIPVGALIRVNPSYYPQAFGSNVEGATISSDKQILLLRECLRSGAVEAKKFKKISFIVVDCSRYWEFQNEYEDWQNKRLSRDKVKIVSPSWILKSIRHFLSNIDKCMDEGLLPKVPVILRTGSWFIDGYTRTPDGGNLYDTLKNYRVITCTPPVTAPAITVVNLNDIQSYYPESTPSWLEGSAFAWEFRSGTIQNGLNAVKVGFLIGWNSTDNFYKSINYVPRTTPVIPTPEEQPTPGDDNDDTSNLSLDERVTRLERIIKDIKTALNQ